MELEVRTIKGPPTDKVSKVAAEKILGEVSFPEGSIVGEVRDIGGVWVASAAIPKTATPPPFEPQEETPPAEGPPSPDGPPADDGGGEEGPPAEEGGEEKPGGDEKKGEGSEKHELSSILHMLTTLMGALGLDVGPASPAGPEGEVGPAPAPGPPGMPSPDEAGGDNKTHTVHERALKPGESPPGTTPVGAPAFASVNPNHPWAGVIGHKRTFTLEEPIGDATMASVRAELQTLAQGTGYSVKRAKEGLANGQRVARVLVQADSA